MILSGEELKEILQERDEANFDMSANELRSLFERYNNLKKSGCRLAGVASPA